MFRGLLFALCAGGLLTACETADNAIRTRDDWVAHSRKTYPGKTSEQAIRASERVIQSLNRGATTIVHSQNGFIARRPYAHYFIIAADLGAIVYDVSASQNVNGVTLSISISRSDASVTAVGVGPTTVFPITDKDSYSTLFSWIDYTLGGSNEWKSCDQLKMEAKDPSWSAMAVCTHNSNGAHIPVEPAS